MNIEKDKIVEKVMAKLWLDNGMLANIVSKLQINIIEDRKDKSLAYTNGKDIFINWCAITDEPLYQDLTYDNLVFVVAHELGHIITLSRERIQDRNKELWNYATDYAINEMIYENKSGSIGKIYSHNSYISPNNINGYVWLLDRRFYNMTAEKIYEKLLDNSISTQKYGIKCDSKGNKGNGGSQENNNDNEPKLPMGFDNHDKIKPMTDEEQAELKAKIDNAIRESQMSGCAMNDLCERAYQYLLKPNDINWKSILSKYIKSFVASDYTWKTRSRRSCAIGQILPNHNQVAQIKIGIAIDTSGSIQERQITEFLSQINNIMKSFSSFSIDLWCFSTQVHTETLQNFTKRNCNQIIKYKTLSRGGTDIKSNFDYLTAQKSNYDLFLCMTDGYDTGLHNIVYKGCPVLWLINNNESFTKPSNIKNQHIIHIKNN